MVNPVAFGNEVREEPTLGERLRLGVLAIEDVYWMISARSYGSFVRAVRRTTPRGLERAGALRARRAFYRALRRVPAYRSFVLDNAARAVPEMDKLSYIDQYPVDGRCVFGKLPMHETMIDESSGSTGAPYNWVRSLRERRDTHRAVDYFARYCFGDEPAIVLNAFSMGAWATGTNMGIALQRFGVVKNTGPDVEKILRTMALFGREHRYLLVGYPPFMKLLVDQAAPERALDGFWLDALVGGEGMSEGLRDYLLRSFRRVYSGYGASDLELGVAGETPLSVAIRRIARKDEGVRRRLFGPDLRMPMLFQYNPLMHHIEVNDDRELTFTISRGDVLSPRIRYNLHDEGGIARFDEMEAALRESGHSMRHLADGGQPPIPLPFLWVHGRRDSTISIMGANIYPEDVEECVYGDPDLAAKVTSFCQELTEGAGAAPRACFHFEMADEPSDCLRALLEERILKTLTAMNADFRQAARESLDTMRPEVRLHKAGEGPFAANAHRIKHIRRIGSG